MTAWYSGAHRQIRIFPAAEDAQALEIRALHVDVFRRVLAALGPDLAGGHRGLACPSSLSTLISIGRPWQSQPGTYGESKPAMVFDLTMKSFRILLNAVPR